VSAQAQTAVAENPGHLAVADYFFNPLFYLAVFMVALVVLVIYALVRSVHALTQQLAPKQVAETKAERVKKDRRSFGSNLLDNLTRTVPVAQEKDILLDHNYDDIRELDNQLPPW
jgi:cytochrome c oxidase cbb3-type subunit 3